jgi:hypothetical protein
MTDSVLLVPFAFRWVVGRGNCYIDGPNDGYPVGDDKMGERVVITGVIKE